MCLKGKGRGERLECSLDGLVGGWRDGCKAYWFLSTARLKSEVVESYQLRTMQTKEKREIGLNKFPHMLCKTALLINETELSLITMRLSVVYNNKKCPTVLAHQVGAIVLPTQIVIKK